MFSFKLHMVLFITKEKVLSETPKKYFLDMLLLIPYLTQVRPSFSDSTGLNEIAKI